MLTQVERRSTASLHSALLFSSMAKSKPETRLPEPESANIAEEKIVGYLLSPTHRAGKSKAAFFGKHGFSAENWQLFADALRRHARDNAVWRMDETAFGVRYVVDGLLLAPDGTRLNVRSVWFISHGSALPRFATAHPLKRKTK